VQAKRNTHPDTPLCLHPSYDLLGQCHAAGLLTKNLCEFYTFADKLILLAGGRVVAYSEVTVGHRSPVIIARHSRGSSQESVTLANSSHLGVHCRDESNKHVLAMVTAISANSITVQSTGKEAKTTIVSIIPSIMFTIS